MAAHPIVTVGDDGKVDIPEELQADPSFQKGAKLQLVPVASSLESDGAGAWTDFIALRGIFADEPGDANELLEEERLRELAEESR